MKPDEIEVGAYYKIKTIPGNTIVYYVAERLVNGYDKWFRATVYDNEHHWLGQKLLRAHEFAKMIDRRVKPRS